MQLWSSIKPLNLLSLISVIKLPVHPAAAKACMRASAALAGDIDIVLTATNKRNHQFWQTANPCIKYKPAFWSSCALILKNASTCNNYFINALCCRIISYFIHIQVHSFHLLSIKWQHCCDDEIFKLHCCTIVPGRSVRVHWPQFYHLKPISCFCFCFCLTTSMFLSFQFDFLICNRKSMLTISITIQGGRNQILGGTGR